MVEEEGAAVGEADVLVREVFACGGVGWEGEDLVVVLGVGAFWHGYSTTDGRVDQKVGLQEWFIVLSAP